MEKRIEWIDFIKGLAIMLVVLGHACIPKFCNIPIVSYIYLIINSINMPIFFYLSGYVFYNKFKKENLKNFLIKKSKRLLCPYFLYLTSIYCLILIFSYVPILKVIASKNNIILPNKLKDVISDFILCKGIVDKHIWFIYVLFFIFIISFILREKNKKYNYIIVIIFLVLSITNLFDSNKVIWKILYYYLFFFMGKIDLYKKLKKNSKNIFYIIFLLFIFEFIYIIFINQLKKYIFILKILKFIIAITSIDFYILLSINLKKYNRLYKIFGYFGKRSFEIYLLHQPFIVSGGVNILYTILGNVMLSIILGFIIGLFLPIILYKIWNNLIFFVKEYWNE